ncbi:variable large family protein [Borrelia maritima]|uniref:variable large family protein n=1 Tax=Borrelia maritima TaxID=2761123 RepID=UPI00225E3AC0|nr:variable large family protein [Borrelia maritima]
MLAAIVDAAEKGNAGQAAGAAKNAIEAAIGSGVAADFNDNNGIGKKNDQIAAAIVLRGLAKSGKFALDAAGSAGKATLKSAAEEMAKAESGNSDIVDIAVGGQGASANVENVKGIAKGIKTIVDTAKKSDAKLELKAAAEGGSNKEAGKLFAVNAVADAGDANVKTAAEKAATAVSSVSGEQILAAIVDAAEKGDAGKAAGEAKNAIEAAIGSGAAADFSDNNNGIGKKNDQIAAAIVLRGLAKSGKFALDADGSGKATLKSAAESAVGKMGGVRKLRKSAKKEKHF